MVLTRLQAGSRPGGAASRVVSDHRQGSIGEKPQTGDRICTLNMCVFVLWNLSFLIY